MARYQLNGTGWSVGQYVIPAGTALDTGPRPEGDETKAWYDWCWQGINLPATLPPNAAALDQEAYVELLKQHPPEVIQIASDQVRALCDETDWQRGRREELRRDLSAARSSEQQEENE